MAAASQHHRRPRYPTHSNHLHQHRTQDGPRSLIALVPCHVVRLQFTTGLVASRILILLARAIGPCIGGCLFDGRFRPLLPVLRLVDILWGIVGPYLGPQQFVLENIIELFLDLVKSGSRASA